MTTARRAKPLYRSTNVSRTMPVAVLIAIATKRGDQPCVSRWRTCSLRFVMIAHPTAASASTTTMMIGTGVPSTPRCSSAMTPRSERVTRSPRHAATGGAMLSEAGALFESEDEERRKSRTHQDPTQFSYTPQRDRT